MMVGTGLTAPLVSQLLASAGLAQTPARPALAPTRRGGGGHLRTLWWQGPTLLNPHFAAGLTNADGSRLFYEPLAAFDPDGSLVPVLAEVIHRNWVAAGSSRIRGVELSGWDSTFWRLPYWHREA